MDKLEYYKKRFYAFYNALADLEGSATKDYMDRTWRADFDKAFEKKDMKYLKALNKEISVVINESSSERRQELNKRIETEAGIDAEEAEKTRLKKLQTILKRGKIKNRDEYELIHSRIDELVHHRPKDDPARKDLVQLEFLLREFYTPD